MDVLGHAGLVAIMSMGQGYHRESEQRLHRATVSNGGAAPVVTSAGALVAGLQALSARRIALVAPYMKPLTQLVINYIEAEGRVAGVRCAVTELPGQLPMVSPSSELR